MSQSPYNPISQGPATIPMDNYGQQRITPAPVPWCTPRRTKVIIAIVILTILWIAMVVVWIVTQIMVTAALEDAARSVSYSYASSRNNY